MHNQIKNYIKFIEENIELRRRYNLRIKEENLMVSTVFSVEYINRISQKYSTNNMIEFNEINLDEVLQLLKSHFNKVGFYIYLHTDEEYDDFIEITNYNPEDEEKLSNKMEEKIRQFFTIKKVEELKNLIKL